MTPFTIDDSLRDDDPPEDPKFVVVTYETMQLVKTTLRRLSSLVDVEEQGQIKELLSRLV